jgi:hypothetical protein
MTRETVLALGVALLFTGTFAVIGHHILQLRKRRLAQFWVTVAFVITTFLWLSGFRPFIQPVSVGVFALAGMFTYTGWNGNRVTERVRMFFHRAVRPRKVWR